MPDDAVLLIAQMVSVDILTEKMLSTWTIIQNVQADSKYPDFMRSRRNVDYHLTQFLTRYFKYCRGLHLFGQHDSPFDSKCISAYQDPEYVLSMYPRFVIERKLLEFYEGRPY